MIRNPPAASPESVRILLAISDLGMAEVDEIHSLLQKRSRLLGIVPVGRVPDRQALMQRLNALVRQGFLYVDHIYLLTPRELIGCRTFCAAPMTAESGEWEALLDCGRKCLIRVISPLVAARGREAPTL